MYVTMQMKRAALTSATAAQRKKNCLSLKYVCRADQLVAPARTSLVVNYHRYCPAQRLALIYIYSLHIYFNACERQRHRTQAI